MLVYIIRRLLYTPLIVIGVLFVTFILFRIIPGDVARTMAGKNSSPEMIEEIKHEYGFDKPLFLNIKAARNESLLHVFDSQFFDHFIKTVTFQFGRSWPTKQKIITIIADGAIPSLKLTIPMFIGLITISISISLLIAFVRGTVWDVSTVILCVVGMSIPMLAIILFGQYYFAGKLNWFPIQGYEQSWSGAKFFVLPAILGVISGLGGNVRFYRTVMLDEIKADYIRTAYAKGVSTPRVMFVHLLKNAMIPIITQVVLAIPFLFLGSLLLERFFGIPGLGFMMIEAIGSYDFPVINALTFIISLLFVLGQLMTDICYTLVDPRISLK